MSVTTQTPAEYIAAVVEPRQSDIQQLQDVIAAAAPHLDVSRLGGPGIRYGRYRYTYASSLSGESSIVSLASNKQYISVYVECAIDGQYMAEIYKEKLPKASIGKSCIRFKRASDIDLKVLREIRRTGGAGACRRPRRVISSRGGRGRSPSA